MNSRAGKDRSIHKGGQGGNSRFDLDLEVDVEIQSLESQITHQSLFTDRHN